MRLTLIVTVTVAIFAAASFAVLPICQERATITVSDAPPLRPVPKFVYSLNGDDYQAWAEWQNRQADDRLAEFRAAHPEKPYLTAPRQTVTTDEGVRGYTGGYSNGTTINRSIVGYAGPSQPSIQVVEQGTARYVNPDYVPPPPVTIYNPFVKPTADKTVGSPDWNNIFVPCEKGTMTMTEALKKERGPVNAERLFRKLMAPYFQD